MNQFSDDFIQFNDKKARKERKNLALYFAATITLYVILFFFLLFFRFAIMSSKNASDDIVA